MKLHWRILIALVAGALVGGLLQSEVSLGATFESAGTGGAQIVEVEEGGAADRAGLVPGDRVLSIVRNRGDAKMQRTIPVADATAAARAVEEARAGDEIWLTLAGRDEPVAVRAALPSDSLRRQYWFADFFFDACSLLADVFMSLLKMLIVPIVLSSIITGVTGVGSGRELGRLGAKTFAYYLATSMLAALLGLSLVNAIQPGAGADLGLDSDDAFQHVVDKDFTDVIREMIPTNVFGAFSDNGKMLQVIIFALMFGYFITRTPEPHRERLKTFFEAVFEVMMKMAHFVLSLIPYGVFVLLVKVVGEAGLGLFKPLAIYMLTVAAGLLLHAVGTLPLLLKFVGRVSPLGWLKAMGPALMTAFSTSSSSMTLPVTMETVEHRGKVSNKTTSFVLPLGATINMDGTALYECAGVIFLAQYYAGIGDFTLTLGDQVLVVFMALLASIGAAGIPSAGLVMMLTILGALGLPLEGAALLLAVDRPLDMLRTVVNVWSDSCGAAMIARTEGEQPLAEVAALADTG